MVVRGHVQGVGFRWWCARRAAELGVSGWVLNRPDGSVEIVAEGPGAAVDALHDWAVHGPPGAHVTSVDATGGPPAGLTGFAVEPHR